MARTPPTFSWISTAIRCRCRDSTGSDVRASHFLELSAFDHVISESYRVLKPDGHFIFAVPYANSADGMYPGHLIFLTNLSKRRIFSSQSTL